MADKQDEAKAKAEAAEQSRKAAEANKADQAAHKEAERAANQAKKDASDSVSEQRKAMIASNEAAMARMDNSRPTPTQKENDLAKVGALNHDDKVDDGSGDEQEAVQRTLIAKASGVSYDTRDMAAHGADAKHRRDNRGGKK